MSGAGQKGLPFWMSAATSYVCAMYLMWQIRETRENSRTPWLWTMEDQHIVPIMTMLERNYGAGGDDLGEQIAVAAQTLADEYWADNQKDFFYIIDDSFLEGYDNYNIGIQFKTAVTPASLIRYSAGAV